MSIIEQICNRVNGCRNIRPIIGVIMSQQIWDKLSGKFTKVANITGNYGHALYGVRVYIDDDLQDGINKQYYEVHHDEETLKLRLKYCNIKQRSWIKEDFPDNDHLLYCSECKMFFKGNVKRKKCKICTTKNGE